MKRILFLILSLSFLMSCNKSESPMSLFSYDKNSDTAPATVSFNNLSTNSDSYIWDFGDGNTSTEINPVHIYNEGGDYVISLTAIGNNEKDISEKSLSINYAEPFAEFSFTGAEQEAPCTVVFTNLSKNADAYKWDFDDGNTSTEINPVHIYNEGGNYNVTLTATGKGGENSKTKLITIKFHTINTYVTFHNPTPTTIYLYVNTSLISISPNSDKEVNVTGTSLHYHGYTHLSSSTGEQIGLEIKWDKTITLDGTAKSISLDIPEDYFFLYIKNMGTHTLYPIKVINYPSDIIMANISIPTNGNYYKIGYYKATINTEVRAYYYDAPSNYTYWEPEFQFTKNQIIYLTNPYKQ